MTEQAAGKVVVTALLEETKGGRQDRPQRGSQHGFGDGAVCSQRAKVKGSIARMDPPWHRVTGIEYSAAHGKLHKMPEKPFGGRHPV